MPPFWSATILECHRFGVPPFWVDCAMAEKLVQRNRWLLACALRAHVRAGRYDRLLRYQRSLEEFMGLSGTPTLPVRHDVHFCAIDVNQTSG